MGFKGLGPRLHEPFDFEIDRFGCGLGGWQLGSLKVSVADAELPAGEISIAVLVKEQCVPATSDSGNCSSTTIGNEALGAIAAFDKVQLMTFAGLGVHDQPPPPKTVDADEVTLSTMLMLPWYAPGPLLVIVTV
jgi:hypothetical protein